MTLNVVVVGAGWVARARHVPAFRRDARARVLGVVDPHPDRAESLAAEAGASHWGTSLNESWLEQAGCLAVATPPLEHAELIRTALDRGWHCLCEKPLALPAALAAELAERADREGRVLAVVHNFQFSRSGRRLFELVESGALGQIRGVQGWQLSSPDRRLPHWYDSIPGGLFVDESPHLLYLLRRVLGRLEPRAVDGRVQGTSVTNLMATFEHERIWATLSMSFDAAVSEWQFLVVGEAGVAAFDIFRDVLVVVPNDGAHRAREILRTSAHLVAGHLGGVVGSGVRLLRGSLLYGNDEVVSRFLDAVEGRRDRLAWIAAEDGVAVVACLEELAARTGVPL